MTLTVQQIQEYIDDDGMHCPYCKSENLEWGFVDSTSAGACQEVSCLDCGKLWFDEHKLVSINEA